MRSPNVVFLMVDQLNYRDLGYMKHPVVKTPNLDGLRNDSVAFSRCYVQNAFCLPSRACYLTGQYVFHHREYGFTGLLDERTPCMAKHFQGNGYRTFHVGKLHVNPFGENLGFDTLIPTLPEDIYQSTDMNTNYQVYCQKAGLGYPNDQVHGDDFRFPGIRQALSEKTSGLSFVGVSDVPSRDSIERYTADRAIDFIQGGHDRPFFAHISFDRPHGPWSPSPEYADRYPIVVRQPERHGHRRPVETVQMGQGDRRRGRHVAGLPRRSAADLHPVRQCPATGAEEPRPSA
jgi:arylsulfatase A-like enzyme